VNDEELIIVYETRKGQQSEVTKRTMRRNAPKNSLNEFISRERKRKNIP